METSQIISQTAKLIGIQVAGLQAGEAGEAGGAEGEDNAV